MHKLLTAIMVITCCVLLTSSSSAQSFNCSKATNAVEKMICSDDELKALDSKMASFYSRALAKSSAKDKRMLRTEQVGWLKARNQCAGRDGMKACIGEFYEQRISRLDPIAGGPSQEPAAAASTKVIYSCNDNIVAQVVATFTGAEKARVEFADSTWNLTRVQSGSGAKYANKDVMFWSKGSEATLECRKKSYQCKESK